MTYQLPHALDRPGQQEALDWIMNSKKRFLIIQAPTGSGKSAWAAAASLTHKVLALVETKSLQSANYKDSYGFDILYGKSNYPCEQEPGSKWLWTAFDCGKPGCDCPYNEQEKCCAVSQRVSLNYAKFLVSGGFVNRHRPDILFLDEAHNLPEITINFAGVSVRWKDEFIRYPNPPKQRMQLTFDEAMFYLSQILAVLKVGPNREADLKRWRKWKRLRQKLEMSAALLSQEPKDWYFEADKERLLIKPLTAKYQFLRLFDRAPKIVLMSATIKPSIAERLGIRADDFDFHSVPNPWPAPARLIYDLDAPRMVFRCSDEDRSQQARLIATVCKPDKTGTIHVSSKKQASDLSDRLFELGVNTWLPTDGIGTDKQLEAWYRARRPGLYCISWCFHEGVDLGGDDICILAKVPFGKLGEPYEKTKKDYDSDWYAEQAAYRIEQTAGRPRRGKKEHYGAAKEVYLADGSWKSLKRLLSQDFLKAVRMKV